MMLFDAERARAFIRVIASLAFLAFISIFAAASPASAQSATPAPSGPLFEAQATAASPAIALDAPLSATPPAVSLTPVAPPAIAAAANVAAPETVMPPATALAVAQAAAATDAASTATPSSADPTSSDFRPRDYVLGVGDRLRLIVFQEPTLSGEFAIDSTGLAALPLIGDVRAAGLTVRQFEEAVENQLKRGYLNDPRVSAEVLNFRPYYILGEVARPGEYPYTSNLTVLNAVATAGGFAGLANRTRVYIKRAGEETEAEAVLTGTTIVRPGDTIRIAKGSFYILGEVNRPGEYAYSDGLTVIAAVATAGGYTARANRGRIFIQREGAAEEDGQRLTPAIRVRPGDTLRVGERFF